MSLKDGKKIKANISIDPKNINDPNNILWILAAGADAIVPGGSIANDLAIAAPEIAKQGKLLSEQLSKIDLMDCQQCGRSLNDGHAHENYEERITDAILSEVKMIHRKSNVSKDEVARNFRAGEVSGLKSALKIMKKVLHG